MGFCDIMTIGGHMKKFNYERYEKSLVTPEEDEKLIKKLADSVEDVTLLREIIKNSSRVREFNGTSREELLKGALLARKAVANS